MKSKSREYYPLRFLDVLRRAGDLGLDADLRARPQHAPDITGVIIDDCYHFCLNLACFFPANNRGTTDFSYFFCGLMNISFYDAGINLPA